MSRVPQGLKVRLPDGSARAFALQREAITLGRSSTCTLHFPEDLDLSRHHLRLEPADHGWVVEDLKSKNGTRVNGEIIEGPRLLKSGDLVEAGRLIIEFLDEAAVRPTQLVFEDDSTASHSLTTVVTRLAEILDDTQTGPEPLSGAARVRALVHAGRELAGHRPLDELFNLILDLALDSSGCTRGMLVTKEDDEMVIRAARGDKFRLSTGVRDRVLEQKESLLVLDAQLDEKLKMRMSIVEGQVRSMMAVPLQTSERVIGLIYVDSPKTVKALTRDDLSLLTVLANVAAIRIEHQRLTEVEHAEQLLAREMQQAAEIQRRLLPATVPKIPGLDLAGFNVPCHTVGGDYYDFFAMEDGRVMAVVGDVAGKGMPAALLMANLQARVQILSEDCQDVSCMVTKLNRAITLHCPTNRFITFFSCTVEPQTGRIAYSNAGHNPPLLARASGNTDVLTDGGLILGIQPSARYAEYRGQLGKGDVLLLYSDGVTDTFSPGPEEEAEEFGIKRLGAVLQIHREKPAQEIIRAIRDAVSEFAGGNPVADDVTLLVIRRPDA